MDDFHKKPGSPGDVLKHHGVKGMKWGVVKEDDTGGGGKGRGKPPTDVAKHNAETKMYISALAKIPQVSDAQGKIEYAKNLEKSANKMVPSGPPVKAPGGKVRQNWDKLSPGQKKALLWGGGALVVYGGLTVAGVKLQKAQLTKVGIKNLAEIDGLAGKSIAPDKFGGLVGFSQGKTWFGAKGYLTPSAFARPEFELPAGHTFFRLSGVPEGDFQAATYATHSVEDFNRYVAGFRHELYSTKLHKVTWESTDAVKVPNLTTVLGQMSEVLKERGESHGQEATMRAYNEISGGTWKDPRAVSLINKLKTHGFGALVDEMDAGVIGETPLVFFSPEKASPKAVSTFDSSAIKQAEAALKEIGKPPGRKY